MLTWIYSKQIMTPDRIFDDSVIIVENGRIKAIESHWQVSPHPEQVQVIDARRFLVIPGLIDIHVHGSVGSDTMDATPDSLTNMSAFFVKHGVTSFLPTTITQSRQATNTAVQNVLQYREEDGGAHPLGIHLEGPYLSREYKGAQPAEFLRDPEPSEYQKWFETGIIQRMTIAPELPGSLDLIRAGVRYGVRFSAGHTGASYAQIKQAMNEGLSQSTHTFNGMAGLHHREPGVLGAILSDDRITCEVIADGVHVHPAVLQLLVRLKGVERVILVTDAIRAAGLEDDSYDLGGQFITVHEHIARTAAGGLAGSTLTLERAVWNMVHMGEVSIQHAVTMATANSAAAAGFAGQKGVIKPGVDADITIVDSDFNIWLTMISGKVVYHSTNHELKE